MRPDTSLPNSGPWPHLPTVDLLLLVGELRATAQKLEALALRADPDGDLIAIEPSAIEGQTVTGVRWRQTPGAVEVTFWAQDSAALWVSRQSKVLFDAHEIRRFFEWLSLVRL